MVMVCPDFEIVDIPRNISFENAAVPDETISFAPFLVHGFQLRGRQSQQPSANAIPTSQRLGLEFVSRGANLQHQAFNFAYTGTVCVS
jgi:hypothetical protein